ncbi:unnamed protein product [Urochloa decumbens]|uniref:[histone H3]-lysine(27) N-methyltransferase n=1 Tax=Urochloa decumbens TaxID=240449 RepID=A0ABC9BBM0_9POAL
MADVMRRPCLVCRQDPTPLRFASMAEVMRRSRPVDDAPAPAPRLVAPAAPAAAPAPRVDDEATVCDDDDVVCGTCGSGDYGEELLICDGCDIGCHTYCLRTIVAKVPNGPWFCPDCVVPVEPLEKKWPEAPTREAIVYDDDVVICGTCGSGHNSEKMLICDGCSGGCHTYCLHTIVAKVPNGPWFCPDCTPPVEPLETLPENIPNEATDLYDDVVCDTCGSSDHGDELLLCDGCDRGRHTFCARPIVAKVPNGPWFCPDCGPPIKPLESFPVEQSKINDFFRIQNYDQDGEPAKDVRNQRKRTLLLTKKKRRRILPYVPSKDITTRLRQMASLATALTSSKAEFSNELTYMPNMAPRSSNQARLEEGGIQVLNKKDKETIELCRTMQERGQCPPLLVVFDSREGFTLQADAHIKDMTFIAEFAGDVDYLEIREHDDSNCMMTLLLTADPSQSLVICQDKRANISRFISGINNHTPEGRKRQNVKCVRYDIDGESHVLLVTCRDIASGEKLYCDYNGKEDAYPTHHFTT